MSGTIESSAPSAEQVRTVLRDSIRDLADFVGTAPFQGLLDELYDLPEEERPRFVLDVVLDPDERERRGLRVPDDVKLQRTQFADGRPTLFAAVKLVPLAYPWQKVTVTFDSR